MPIGFDQKAPFVATKGCKQSLCVLLVAMRVGSDSAAQL